MQTRYLPRSVILPVRIPRPAPSPAPSPTPSTPHCSGWDSTPAPARMLTQATGAVIRSPILITLKVSRVSS